jgi:cyclopropane fatty-acyl-phospholipid synthase-like methyltransferase
VITTCPACGDADLSGFHHVDRVPTNSCLLLDDLAEARSLSSGVLDLAFCGACGFIFNREFDPALAEYSSRYEETQAYSATFEEFGRDLASSWVERYGLHGRHVLEIGCGKGEFLVWMLEAGAGSGTGIDPGVRPDRLTGIAAGRICWIADRYDDRWAHLQADAVVCRHTLEHIQPVRSFLSRLRTNLGDRDDVVVLFELPDVARVLQEAAFWDTYYEHCSYFSAGSLARLFRRCGFEVLDLARAYEDQYLLVEARPCATPAAPGVRSSLEDDLASLEAGISAFQRGYARLTSQWRSDLASVASSGGRVILWGGGSKAVAFLAALGEDERVDGVVDINPHKHGRFLAGTGHRVLAPAELRSLRPALVVAMNPIYLEEIRCELEGLGLADVRLVAL